MVEYIKGLLGFGDSAKTIPEIILIKNEPKHYYDRSLNKWVFEGEEDFMKDKKEHMIPPSKKKCDNINNKQKDTEKNDTSTRYKNILHQDQIIRSQESIGGLEESTLQIKEQQITINTLRNEINKLNELIAITDDKCNECQHYYKEELNKYIKENITLQETITDLNQKIIQKNNEINQYQILIAEYQSILNNKTKSVPPLKYSDEDNQTPLNEVNDYSFSLNKGRTDLLINSKLDKLKSENMFLSNDLKKLQIDNMNYKCINDSLTIELNSLRKELQFKEKHIGLLERKISDSQSSSFENTGFLSKMNKLTGENIVLKSQNEKLKVKLSKAKSQLDNYQTDYNEVVDIKKELLLRQIKITDLNTEIMNLWSFIKNECNQVSINDGTIFDLLSNNPSIINLFSIIKYLFKTISLYRNEISLLSEREGYLKEENDNYQLEIEIVKDQLKENSSELLINTEQLNDSNRIIKDVNKTNRELNSKIKEMMNILTQTQNEYEKETKTRIKLENEIKLLMQSNIYSNQSISNNGNLNNTIHNTSNQSVLNIKNKLNKK